MSRPELRLPEATLPARIGGAEREALALAFRADAFTAFPGIAAPSLVSDRLRYKRHTSVGGSLLEAGSARPVAWFQVLAPEARAKADNALRRAHRRGFDLDARELPGGWTAVAGPIDADPRLRRALDVLGPLGATATRLWRYNPMRRIVAQLPEAAGQATIVRLTAETQRHQLAVVDELARRAPVLPPLRRHPWPRGSRVSYWPFLAGGCDAPACTLQALQAAGQLAAALHRLDPDTVLGADLRLEPLDPAARLLGARSGLAALDPELADRFDAITRTALAHSEAGSAGDRTPSIVHGDFSRDQMLRDGSGAWVLNDLDRVAVGPGVADLASFLAVALLETGTRTLAAAPEMVEPLLASYSEAGGSLPPRPLLTAWVVLELGQRCTEPFRAARPTWRDEISDRLSQMEDLL